MTEQERLDKAINGLEQFIADFKPFCGNKADWQRVYDALTLLKAREPRVLRVEEVVLLKQNDVVWLEDYNKKDVIPAIVSRMGPMVICIEFALSDRFISVGYDDYGSRWRCWTSRPTNAQREAMSWIKQ